MSQITSFFPITGCDESAALLSWPKTSVHPILELPTATDVGLPRFNARVLDGNGVYFVWVALLLDQDVQFSVKSLDVDLVGNIKSELLGNLVVGLDMPFLGCMTVRLTGT